MAPTLREEKKLWRRGFKYVAGLDEAGRGALAGPVVAGAVVILSHGRLPFQNLKHLRDSKKLTPKKREEFYKIIRRNHNIKWGIGIVSERIIDKINIKNAAELAMEKALQNLEKKLQRKVDFLIIDGNHLNSLKLKKRRHKLIIKGDEKVCSCTLASILAKYKRDRIMEEKSREYPEYQFFRHKGYFTKLHRKLLKKLGPSPLHRKSFSPVDNLL